jgi:hypothetical protein
VKIRVLGLDPGHSTGYFLTQGYEPVTWGSTRDVRELPAKLGQVDVVVFEDALDLDRVAPLRDLLPVPWVGVTPEQLQRRLFTRVLGRKQSNGPIARQEVTRRAFGRPVGDVHALDAACLALWWLIGSNAAEGAPDLGNLRVWDIFTIETEDGPETYQIVPPNTADPAQGLVSWASPLVQAVAHAQVGQEVWVQAPAGRWPCRLKSVEPREV